MTSTKQRRLVFDSWSIIAYYEDEPAGKNIADIITQATERKLPMWMSIVNAAEVWYIVARKTSPVWADNVIEELHSLGIQFDDVVWDIARQAALIKSKYTMSLADAFAAALAMKLRADLITGDKEFKQIEDLISIKWV